MEKVLRFFGATNPQINGMIARPLDLIAFGLILVGSPIIYLYGTFQVFPIIFENHSPIVQFISWVLATWIFVAIGVNLFLIRIRHSSIRAKLLEDPVIFDDIDSGAGINGGNGGSDTTRRRNNNPLKSLGQQFMAKPFGSDEAWHICSKCETYVPPRSWHCNICNICVLRRDHHCIFALSCIGLENHANFLGLLFYLTAGTIYATFVLLFYSYNHDPSQPTMLWLLFRSSMPLYALFFDFSWHNFLTSFCFISSLVSGGIFMVYFIFSLTGETAGDRKRNVRRHRAGESRYSYKNLKEFLGPNPIGRIVWPLHDKLTH